MIGVYQQILGDNFLIFRVSTLSRVRRKRSHRRVNVEEMKVVYRPLLASPTPAQIFTFSIFSFVRFFFTRSRKLFSLFFLHRNKLGSALFISSHPPTACVSPHRTVNSTNFSFFLFAPLAGCHSLLLMMMLFSGGKCEEQIGSGRVRKARTENKRKNLFYQKTEDRNYVSRLISF